MDEAKNQINELEQKEEKKYNNIGKLAKGGDKETWPTQKNRTKLWKKN